MPRSELAEAHHLYSRHETAMDLDAAFEPQLFHAPDHGSFLPPADNPSPESYTAGPSATITKAAERPKGKGKKKGGKKKSPAAKGKVKTGESAESEVQQEVDELDEDEVKDEPETTKGKKEKGGKKALIAKKPVWEDLPDWTGRDDCPLMTLPLEVLDMCFCVREDLASRDYIALAGVSTFFRHHLDDAFFEALDGARRPVVTYTNMYLPPASKEYQFDPQVAAHPFTRNIPVWRVPRPLDSIPRHHVPAYMVPDGPRDTWSHEEYESYKLSKAGFIEGAKDTIKGQWEAIATTARDIKYVEHNGRRRSVNAVVLGRLDGEAAVEKGDSGYPIMTANAQWASKLADSSQLIASKDTHMTSAVDGGKKRARAVSVDENDEPLQKKAAKENKGSKGKGKGKGKQKWTAPETDDGPDLEPPPLFDEAGKYKLHDYWPSQKRKLVAKVVNEVYIPKTEAIQTYKVKEAEIITLKHYYIANSLNPKYPQQLFVKAAVEALALRAHGGVDGHTAVLEGSKKRSAKIAETRSKKIAEAKANGTYVHKPRKPFIPHWEKCDVGLLFDLFDYDSDFFDYNPSYWD